MEASLLQAYAPRDPLAEVLTGRITLRQFRVMCEGIARTPDTPVGRAINGPWGDLERLLHGNLTATNDLLAVTFNSKRKEGAEPYRPDPVPRPKPTIWQKKADRKKRKLTQVEVDLLEVIARNQQQMNS